MSAQNLSKAERLRKRTAIEGVLKSGKSKASGCIQLRWLGMRNDRKPPVMVMFAVPRRKLKKAVDRNLVRRRMKEAYRLNKSILMKDGLSAHLTADLIFIYLSDNIREFSEIQDKIVLLLKALPSPDGINA